MDTLQTLQPKVRFSQNPNYAQPDRYLWLQPGAIYTRNIYSGPLRVFKDRICGGFQYVPQFALYQQRNKTDEGRPVNIIEVIRMMKGAELKRKSEEIKAARDIGDEVLRTKLKASLPCITHTGIFIPRKNEHLILPGFTYQLDVDKISNAHELLQQIIGDKQLNVLFACKSVSGNGVKAMLFLKELLFLRDTWTWEQYRHTYHKAQDILAAYFLEKYKVAIDRQMKAISQPFYLFFAPDLFINKNLSTWC